MPGAISEELDEQARRKRALAAQIAESERILLGGEPAFETRPAADSTPLGVRLLNSIRDVRTRLFVAAGTLMAFIGAGMVAYTAHRHPLLRIAAFVAAVALLVLFSPSRPRRGFWDE